VDEKVDNFVLCVGGLGIKYSCARNSEAYASVRVVCAQSGPHHRTVAGVTCESEVFLQESSEMWPASALGALPNASGELLDVIEHLASLGHLGQDLALGVHDRSVVTAECLTDFRQ
jgi:hypothetical protein